MTKSKRQVWYHATVCTFVVVIALTLAHLSLAQSYACERHAPTTPLPTREAQFRSRDRHSSRSPGAIPDVTPGFQAALSNKALEFAAKSVMPVVCDGLHMTILPDWSGETNDRRYNITDVSVTRVAIEDAAFDFTTRDDGGLVSEMRNVSLHISFNWNIADKERMNTRLARSYRNCRNGAICRGASCVSDATPRAYVSGEGPVTLLYNYLVNEGDNDNNSTNPTGDNGDDDDDCHCGGLSNAPRLRESGTGTAIFTQGTLRTVIHMGTQGEALRLKPAFNVTSATFAAEAPEIRINGNAPDGLSGVVSADFTKRGNEALSQALLRRSQKAAEHISRAIAKRMNTRRVCPALGELDVAFVTGVPPVRYYDRLKDPNGKPVSAIAIALNGEMYTRENAHKPNPSDNVVPRDSAAIAGAFRPSGRMFDATLSLFSLNSVIHAMCQAGGINVVLSRKTVPPQFQLPWNTNEWAPILPQLPAAYPNAEVAIVIKSASREEPRLDEPRFHVTDARMLENLLKQRVTIVAPQESFITEESTTDENASSEGPKFWRSPVISERTSFSPFIRENLRMNPLSPAVPSPFQKMLDQRALPSFSSSRFRDRKGALALDGPLLIKVIVHPSPPSPEAGKRIVAFVLRADITSQLTVDVKNHMSGPSVLARKPSPLRRSTRANSEETTTEYATIVNNLSRPSRDAPFTTPPVIVNSNPNDGVVAAGSHRARRAEEIRRRRRSQPRHSVPPEELARRRRAALPILPHLSNRTRPCYYRSSNIRVSVPRRGTPRETSSPLINVSSRLNVTHRRIRRDRESLFDLPPNLISQPLPDARSLHTYALASEEFDSRPSRMRARRRTTQLNRERDQTSTLPRNGLGAEGFVTRTARVHLRNDRLVAVDGEDNATRGGVGSLANHATVRLGASANIFTPDGTFVRAAATRTGGAIRRHSAINGNGRLTLTSDNNAVRVDDYEVDIIRNSPAAALAARMLNRLRILHTPPTLVRPAVNAPVRNVAPPQPVASPRPVISGESEPAVVANAPPTPLTPCPHPGHRVRRPVEVPDLHAPIPLGLPQPSAPRATDEEIKPHPRPHPRPHPHPHPCHRRGCENLHRNQRGGHRIEDVTRLYPRVTQARVTFSVIESRIGKLDPTRLNRLAGAFLDLVLIPTLNQRLEKGFPLYCPAGYQVENVSVEFKNNAINVGSDVKYRPPAVLLGEIRRAFTSVRNKELVERAVRRMQARRQASGRRGPEVGC